jgi:hypothetical protein
MNLMGKLFIQLLIKDSKEAYEIEIFPIKNPNDQNEVFMVYKNFELIRLFSIIKLIKIIRNLFISYLELMKIIIS